MDSQINIKRSMEWKEFETTFSVKLNQQQKRSSTEHKRAGTASCRTLDQERPRYW